MGPARRAGNSSTATSQIRRGFASVVLIALTFVLAPPALASPDTLRRAFGNILMGPFDMLLSPIVGVMTTAENLDGVDDSDLVRVAYAVPGVIWLTGLDFGSGGIRTITGFLETVPGIIVFPFETDLDPLFDPAEDAPALIDWENPIADIENPWVYYNPLVAPFAIKLKAGINYTRSEW